MEENEEISVEKSYAQVYDQALRWLARRPYGEQELAARLSQTGAPAPLVEQVLARCRELGYLNDAEFAKVMVQGRLLRDGWGPWKVRAELSHRGVAEALIETALSETLQETDEITLARRALRGHGQAPPPTGKERRKRQEFLARRGFDWDVITRLLGGEFDS